MSMQHGAPTLRRLRAEECPRGLKPRSFPVVLDCAKDCASAADFLRVHSALVRGGLRDAGAVLVRGLARSPSPALLEASVAALGLGPMAEWLAEPGRVRMPDSEFCFDTSTAQLSGGYLSPFVVPHSENFHHAVVPRFVLFLCLHPPPGEGGETALFDGADAFARLPPRIRQRLEGEAFLSVVHRPKASAAALLRLPPTATTAAIVRGLQSRGMHAWPTAMDDVVAIATLKPLVVRRSTGRRPALVVNVGELGGAALRAVSRRLRSEVYGSGHCASLALLWRICDRWGGLVPLLGCIDAAAAFLLQPVAFSYARYLRWRCARAARRPAPAPPSAPLGSSLRAGLRPADRWVIGDAISRSATVWTWRRGDLLVVDNLRVLHDGLPAPSVAPWRRRQLCVALCDEVPVFAASERHRRPHGRRQPGVLVVD